MLPPESKGLTIFLLAIRKVELYHGSTQRKTVQEVRIN